MDGQLGSQGRTARSIGRFASRWALGFAACLTAACGSSTSDSHVSPGGAGTNPASGGAVNLVLPGAGGASGMIGSGGGSTALPGTLPDGYTKTELGGFEIGSQISANGGSTGTGGSSTGSGAAGSAGATASGCGTAILAVIRDFKADHMTFEGPTGDDRGVVQTTLGADRKPVYARRGATRTIASAPVFDEFYHDAPGVNIAFELHIFFAPNNGVTSFQSDAFFPLDDKGWGNDGMDAAGKPHNFHFTTEIHTQFLYNGGETFNFTGDDDVWVFIANQLVIDLGGVHNAENASLSVDRQAATLGLKVGSVYPFDMFYNERHTVASDFRADTDLAFVDCGTIVPDQPVK